MAQGRPDALLKIISVIFIICGVFGTIGAIIGIMGGTVIGFSISPTAGLIAGGAVVLFCASSIISFVAGIAGVTGHYGTAKVFAILMFIAAVFSIVGWATNGGTISDNWGSVVNALLPFLFLVGVHLSRKGA